ncbi:MAG: hypothetical protein ACYCZJ_04340 [Sulfuriferula sp.]
MRLLFLLLLLANLVVFAMLQWGGDMSSAHRAHSSLHPERIALVGEPRATPSPKISPVNAPLPAPQPAQTSAPKPDANDKICMTWGPVAPAQYDDVIAALDQLKLGERLSRQSLGTPGGPYWVYYPPLASKAAADNKLTELTNLGVRDLAVVRPAGPWQNAISLGLYAKQSIAEARVAELHKKGVQTVSIETRGKTPSLFTLRDLDAAEQAKLTQLQQTYADTQLKRVDCAPSSH